MHGADGSERIPEIEPAVFTQLNGAEPHRNEIDFHLNWPDSENLLQSILSAELPTWPSFEPDVAAIPSDLAGYNEANDVSPWWRSSFGQDDGYRGSDAVYQLSNIITSVSTDLTREAQSIGLTSTFLDGCLHMFWDKFVPAFPVVHAPTFVFKDWVSTSYLALKPILIHI